MQEFIQRITPVARQLSVGTYKSITNIYVNHYLIECDFKPVANGEDLWRIDILLYLLCNIHGVEIFECLILLLASDKKGSYLLCILHTKYLKSSSSI